jgi:hypothetical protein
MKMCIRCINSEEHGWEQHGMIKIYVSSSGNFAHDMMHPPRTMPVVDSATNNSYHNWATCLIKKGYTHPKLKEALLKWDQIRQAISNHMK